MSDESVAKPQVQDAETQDPVLARVPRREALKGLGMLAVSTTAFAAVGCSAENMMAEPDNATAGSTAQGASGATTTPSSTTGTGTTAASASSAKPPTNTSTAPGMASSPAASGAASTPTSTAAAAGSAAPASSGAAGSGVASTMGSPAVGGMSPGASAAGSMASGSAGAGAMAPGTAGAVDLSSLACILSPAQEEGPFFIEEKLNRSDLIKGETAETIVKAVPLALTIGVYKVNGMMCEPAPGLQVDIWHADANGIYSDVSPGFVQSTDTKGKQFLRGYQVTGESGLVSFSTIYPGWYPSRTIHIHLKIRMPMGNNSAYDFTSQMYFDENITKEVLTMGPYAKTPGTRMIFNSDDHIYNGTMMNGQKPTGKPPGMDTTVALAKAGPGYTGMIKIGLKI